jgi:hypothetical protein
MMGLSFRGDQVKIWIYEGVLGYLIFKSCLTECADKNILIQESQDNMQIKCVPYILIEGFSNF